MKLAYTELENRSKYRKILEISHEELILFVSDNIRPDNLPMRLFYLFNLPVLGYIFYKLYFIIFISPLNWFYLLSVILVSFILFAIIVIPMHELLHALAFKLLGATKVSIHAQWGRCFFMQLQINS